MAGDETKTVLAQDDNMNNEQDNDTKDKSGSEQPTTSNSTSAAGKKAKARHRASVACATCRDRRIRCVVPPGDNECTQCRRAGVECVIKNDDERRRPISRAYMCSLTERIGLLETMLREKGEDPPPASHPPMTRHGHVEEPPSGRKHAKGMSMSNKMQQSMHGENSNSSPGSQQDETLFDREGSLTLSHHGDDSHSAQSAPSPSMIPPPKKDGMVSRLLSTRGHLSFDQLSGRLRYFGPTTNCHVHSEFGMPTGEGTEAFEQTRRAEKAIRQLSIETYEYLMGLFWTHYNTYLHVVHQEAFFEDKENSRTQFYSPFLHICMLAMGFRFADRTRPDMQKITVAPRESSLHREAKFMLDFELERPGGIPNVVALLILGDMECGVGRDNLGWLYAGMANRIAFDIGLHLDARASGLSQREIDIRRMTLWACVVYDKYWALFLGRPTSIKSSDLEMYDLAKLFERLGRCQPAGPSRTLETQIYEALLDLMELAGKITDNIEARVSMSDTAVIDHDAYLRMAALDREFGRWYARLPDLLKWSPENIRTAPLSFFLLHQQYHVALILLHRPFAMYEDNPASEEDHAGNADTHFSALSRAVCTKQAIRVAKIFWHHRQRFDGRQVPITSMQHAGTAATALVAALAFLKDGNDRNNNMQYLECLSAAMQDMSYAYQPAERMFIVLQAVLAELRGAPITDPQHLIRNGFRGNSGMGPIRRDSSTMDTTEVPSFTKRRHVARANSRASFDSQRPNVMDLHIDPMLASMSVRKHSNTSEMERPESFVLVTPRSEISSWGGAPMTTGAAASSVGVAGSASSASTWMGGSATNADPFEMHDISTLASVHFPELRDLPTIGENGEPGPTPNLDFLSFGPPGDDWRDWTNPNADLNGTGNADMDAFATAQSDTFSTGFNTPGRFESRMAGLADGL